MAQASNTPTVDQTLWKVSAMTKHINLFKLVFRTVVGLVLASTLFAIWDYARCDGPNERCDGKAEGVKNGLLSLVPVFLAWIAPSNDGEEDRPEPPAGSSFPTPVVPPSFGAAVPPPSPGASRRPDTDGQRVPAPDFETRQRGPSDSSN